jgi:hypothetical protein
MGRGLCSVSEAAIGDKGAMALAEAWGRHGQLKKLL